VGVLGDLTYDYDPAGNRTGVGGSFARTLLPAPVDSATYDAANRQLVFGATRLTFDANGSLLTMTEPAGVTSFTWDARNRLQAATTPFSSATFVYDPRGRRSTRAVDGVTTRYLYDGIDAVEDQTDTTSHAYLRSSLIDEPLARAGSEFYLQDALGSVIGLTGSTGTVMTSYTYEPFGVTARADAPTSNPFAYTGREVDADGLYYYRARYYHPGLARFLSEDPEFSQPSSGAGCRSGGEPSPLRYIEIDRGLAPLLVLRFYSASQGVGVNPQSMHLYAYANGNPVNRRDPTGLRAAPQTPGCDAVGWWLEPLNRCARSCCNEHDRCYERASSWCDQSSWLDPFRVRDMYKPDCVECNRAVVRCILKGNITGGRKGCPAPEPPPLASP
jgi:RHS repeat-associated protein